MPRIQRGSLLPAMSSRYQGLLEELMAELKSTRLTGQPRIDEFEFAKTGKKRVIVLWDKWQDVPEYERIAVIQTAYEQTESREFFDQIVMIYGLTFPEAHEEGLLPFQIITALRKGDRVSLDDCRKAMLNEGGSQLFEPGAVVLRFATEAEAEDCVRRLTVALPGSENIWVITRDTARSLE